MGVGAVSDPVDLDTGQELLKVLRLLRVAATQEMLGGLRKGSA